MTPFLTPPPFLDVDETDLGRAPGSAGGRAGIQGLAGHSAGQQRWGPGVWGRSGDRQRPAGRSRHRPARTASRALTRAKATDDTDESQGQQHWGLLTISEHIVWLSDLGSGSAPPASWGGGAGDAPKYLKRPRLLGAENRLPRSAGDAVPPVYPVPMSAAGHRGKLSPSSSLKIY